MARTSPGIFVLYVPGLDLRRVSEAGDAGADALVRCRPAPTVLSMLARTVPGHLCGRVRAQAAIDV